jgi:hypothetical protein
MEEIELETFDYDEIDESYNEFIAEVPDVNKSVQMETIAPTIDVAPAATDENPDSTEPTNVEIVPNQIADSEHTTNQESTDKNEDSDSGLDDFDFEDFEIDDIEDKKETDSAVPATEALPSNDNTKEEKKVPKRRKRKKIPPRM